MDEHQQILPIKTNQDTLYTLLAVTGNRHFQLAGEWDTLNNIVKPLSIWTENEVIPIEN